MPNVGPIGEGLKNSQHWGGEEGNRLCHPYRTDFGAQRVTVSQTLPSSTEEVNKASIVTEDSTAYNRLYSPITAQTLAIKITDFGVTECVAVWGVEKARSHEPTPHSTGREPSGGNVTWKPLGQCCSHVRRFKDFLEVRKWLPPHSQEEQASHRLIACRDWQSLQSLKKVKGNPFEHCSRSTPTSLTSEELKKTFWECS